MVSWLQLFATKNLFPDFSSRSFQEAKTTTRISVARHMARDPISIVSFLEMVVPAIHSRRKQLSAFVFIQFLSFMTTFVDLVSGRRTPSPFGTQYVALLLAAWCPVFIFGAWL